MTIMEIDAFLADSADSVQGKIYGLGIGWNTIYAQTFPAAHPRISVGLTIHVPYTATNQMHRVGLHLETADGERVPIGDQAPTEPDGEATKVYELGGQFNVGRPPLLPPGDTQVVCLAMTINNLTFEQPNMYSWVISIDGNPEKRLPMRVQQLSLPMPL